MEVDWSLAFKLFIIKFLALDIISDIILDCYFKIRHNHFLGWSCAEPLPLFTCRDRDGIFFDSSSYHR